MPRTISSCILVSSRQTTAARSSPCESPQFLAGWRRPAAATRRTPACAVSAASSANRRSRSPALARREALEAEPVGGQPGDGERGGHRGRAWHRGHPDPGRRRGGHQPVAGVADGGHPGVGDDEHVPARAAARRPAPRRGAPRSRRSTTPAARSAARPAPSRAGATRRVSSAAITSALASSAASRAGASSGLADRHPGERQDSGARRRRVPHRFVIRSDALLLPTRLPST